MFILLMSIIVAVEKKSFRPIWANQALNRNEMSQGGLLNSTCINDGWRHFFCGALFWFIWQVHGQDFYLQGYKEISKRM